MKGAGGKRWYREIVVKGFEETRLERAQREEDVRNHGELLYQDDGIEVRARWYGHFVQLYYVHLPPEPA